MCSVIIRRISEVLFFELIMTHPVECTVTACRTDIKVRKGGDFFYGKSTNHENYAKGV